LRIIQREGALRDRKNNMAAPRTIFEWVALLIAVFCVAGQAAAQGDPYEPQKQRPVEQRQQALERRQRALDAFRRVMREPTQIDPVLRKSAGSMVDSINAWDPCAEYLIAETESLSEGDPGDQIGPEDARCLDKCRDAMETVKLADTKGEQDEKARGFDLYGYGTGCSRFFLQR
jgi:hypothetical protein